jgi:hypothetical protein
VTVTHDSPRCYACPGSYVDLSDRLNDKMDEVMEYRDELENWKEKANDWQQKALVAATVTPRGSALDAIPVRKAEMLARGVFFRIYTAISNADRGLFPCF